MQLEGALFHPLIAIAETLYIYVCVCVFILCVFDVDLTSSVGDLAMQPCYTRCRSQLEVPACLSGQPNTSCMMCTQASAVESARKLEPTGAHNRPEAHGLLRSCGSCPSGHSDKGYEYTSSAPAQLRCISFLARIHNLLEINNMAFTSESSPSMCALANSPVAS